MDRKLLLFAVVAALLVACSAKSRSIPRFDDADGATAAARTLSPWADGSPDQSHDQLTPGQEDSDRQLFGKWFIRYAEHEQYTQHDANYQPFPVPSTIGEAIELQREYDAKQAAREKVEDDKRAREAEADAQQATRDEAARAAAQDAADKAQEQERVRLQAVEAEQRRNAEAADADLQRRIVAAHEACYAPEEAARRVYMDGNRDPDGKRYAAAREERMRCDERVNATLQRH